MNTRHRQRWYSNFIFLAMCLFVSNVSMAQTLEDRAIASGQRGMDVLTKAAVDWQNARGGSQQACFACHTQGLSLWGAAIGSGKGFNVNTEHMNAILGNVLHHQGNDNLWLHGKSKLLNTSFALAGLAFYDRDVKDGADAQAELVKGFEEMLKHQSADGRWPTDDSRPNDGNDVIGGFYTDHAVTANMIMAGRRVFEVTNAPKYEQAYQKAAKWLESSSQQDAQGYALKILALTAAQYPPEQQSLKTTIDTLFSRQNADGGFGRTAGAPSSPYQTGISIYALRTAGFSIHDQRITNGLNYLLNKQNAAGAWPLEGASLNVNDHVAPNMWPVIALGDFGELGVDLSADVERLEVEAFAEDRQTVVFDLTLSNTGNSEEVDIYDLQVSGGLSGFVASISENQVTLGKDGTKRLTLSIDMPENLPYGVNLTYSVTATSTINEQLFNAASVTIFTPPPPPSEGVATTLQIIDGQRNTVHADGTVRFAVNIINTKTNRYVYGEQSGGGVVNFYIDGIPVGTDFDEDRNGIFELNWTPGWDWTVFGLKTVLITYSGYDYDEPADDTLFSFATTDIMVKPVVIDPAVIGEGVISGIDEVIEALPETTRQKVIKRLNKAQTALTAAMESHNEALGGKKGQYKKARKRFNNAIKFLNQGIAQLEKQRCPAKPKICFEDNVMELYIDLITTEISDVQAAIALLPAE